MRLKPRAPTAAAMISPSSLRLRAETHAADALRLGRDAASLLAAHRMAIADFELAWRETRPRVAARSAFSCAPGCAHCCHQHVAVHPIEAIAIAAHLAAEPRRDELTRRVVATSQAIAGVDRRERRRRDIACAFLDADGCCAIYAMRPLRCRGLHSIDVAACRRRRDTADAPRSLDAFAFPDEPIRLADAALAGLAAAAAGRGLANSSLELARGVTVALADPQAAAAYASGDDPFATAMLDATPRETGGSSAALLDCGDHE
jgi:hypothetical protein